MKKGRVFKIVASTVSVFLILIAVALTVANSMPYVKGAKETWLIGEQSGLNEGDQLKVAASGNALAELIESEGIVLAKNANNVLPLGYVATKVKGVNVFGWSSTAWVPGGSGSGRTTRPANSTANPYPTADCPRGYYAEIGIVNALTMAGINYNTDLYDFYMNSTTSLNATGTSGDGGQNRNLRLYPYGHANSAVIQGNNRPGWQAGNGGTLKAYDFLYSRIVEPDVDNYSASLKSGAENYSDIAVVVISRVSGESNDSPKVQYKGVTVGSTTITTSTNTTAGNIGDLSTIGDANRHYLEISTEEEKMLTYVGANFEKVVVLINSTNTMELGFMDTIPGLDACLIVGGTGMRAATAIPKVMFDKVPVDANGNLDPDSTTFADGISPSGRTQATYAYDFKTAASWANAGDTSQSATAPGNVSGTGSPNAPTTMGQNYYTGVTREMDLYPIGTAGTGDTSSHPTNGNFNGQYRNTGYLGIAYVDYSEGIYVGYKWYETADTMGYWNNKTSPKAGSGKTGYNAIVQYPFGYGMSYTKFDWELLTGSGHTSPVNNSALTKDGKIKIYVKVTNTGTKAGKEVVQAYFNPPYTSGGVEKASVNLAAFAKTKVLEPNESQTVELEFDVFDMASYDCYNRSGLVGAKGGYVLETGIYQITLRKNAHEVAEDTTNGAELTYTVPASGFVYDKDPASGNSVSNKFTGSEVELPDYDQTPVDGSKESVPVKYMSRANFSGTFPTLQPARAITETAKSVNSYTSAMARAWESRNATTAPTQGVEKDLRVWDAAKNTATPGENDDLEAWYAETDPLTRTKLTQTGSDLARKGFSDQLWQDVLDQISANTLTSGTQGIGVTFMPSPLGEIAIDAIGKPRTRSLDGPNQWSSFANYTPGTAFPCSTVLAQTFNKFLAYKMGVQYGTDAKIGGGNGWLGPGINIHRSPLGGRNYEYYSEDAYLTGIMAAEAVKGAKNMGIYVYLKHLALYDQESNRDNLYTWVTEQALREIYLKPFRITITRYANTGHQATGIMTAYGRIGAVWTGGSYPLLTGVIREEFGFKGAILTDWCDHRYFMNMSQALRAGGDIGINCGWKSDVDSASLSFSDPAFLKATRTAAQNIIWMWLDAEYMAARYNPTTDGEVLLISWQDPIKNFDWINLLIGIYWAVAVIGSGTLLFFAFKKEILGLFGKGKQTSQTS